MTQPALLLDAVAMGLLRKYLVETFGLSSARAILTQLGVAQGWRVAEAMQDEFGRRRALSKEGVAIRGSYEAEQHLLYFGRADAPVCWTLCGLTSGYLSRSDGEQIFVLEDRCAGKGDAACHLVGRTREEWGPERAEDLGYFDAARLTETLDLAKSPLGMAVRSAESEVRARRRAKVHAVPEVDDPHGLVVRSPAMRALVDLARRVGKVDSAVVISGESGVGKRRIARLVHAASRRSEAPFVVLRCGARTESSLESELFGHVAGATADATRDRPGGFEAALGGTLVLDDVDELPLGLQVKVLVALREHEVQRVGDDRTRRVDVRLIAATRGDLTRAVAEGSFRRDLFYKLNVVALQVPPLRERREDLLPLARALLATAVRRLKRKVSSLSPAATEALLRYDWPGNIPELASAMERASALAKGGRVDLEDLPEEIRRAPAAADGLPAGVRPLAEVERDYILAALKHNDGNQTHTAMQLQIGSATLYRKLKSYGTLGVRTPET